MSSKPNFLVVAWHVNEDERSARGHVIAVAETLRWARVLQKRMDADGWFNSSLHHNDRRWSPAFLPAWGALDPVESQPCLDSIPF